jgi:CubicO group peptidase (beta-lactamase class C family)
MDPAELARFVDAVVDEDLPVHGVLVVRNGQVVLDVAFSPFDRYGLHDVASVTKSVTAALVGIAIGRGEIKGLDQRVLEFFPGSAAAASDRRRRDMTIGDLLTMRSGIDCHLEPGSDQPAVLRMMGSVDWAAYALGLPMKESPGTAFRYCSPGSHLLSVIVGRTTGMSAVEYARRNLFEPIGIERFDWPTDAANGDPHGWGDLALSRYDMARIGWLYLNGGAWQGRQVVPADWVRASLERRVAVEPFGPIDGYGLHWWTSSRGFAVAMGRGDQWIATVPAARMVVVVIGSGRGDVTARKADLVQRHLLSSVRSDGPLPPDPAAAAHLRAAVARAESPRPQPAGAAPALPPTARLVAGIPYSLDANPYGFTRITLSFPSSSVAALDLELSLEPPLHAQVGLDGAWRTFTGRRDFLARARGRWIDGDTMEIKLDELALINRFTLTLGFRGRRLMVRLDDEAGNPSASFEGVAATR